MKGIIVSIILIYMLFLFVVAYWSNKKIKNNEDYLVAGRTLGPVVIAFTISATEIGGGSSLSIIEKSYGEWGFSAIWYILAMAIAFWCISFIAPRIRFVKVKTIPEFFRRRYDDDTALLTSIIMIFPLIGLAASQLIVAGSILSTIIGINYHIAVAIVAITIIAYTSMGGFYGVSHANVVQFIVLFLGMFLCIVFMVGDIANEDYFINNNFSINSFFKNRISFKMIISLIIMYIASFSVGQEILPGLYASKNLTMAKKASKLAAFINVVFSLFPVAIGMIFIFYINYVVGQDVSLLTSDTAVVSFEILNKLVPPIILALFFAGVLSATMSSADSDIFGAASIFGNDIYRVYINKNATESKTLEITQKSIIIVGLFAVIVALFNKTSVIDLLMLSFTLRAGGVFIPYILGHYWDNASAKGALISIISGSLVVLVMEQFGLKFFGFDTCVPSIIVSFIVFVFFSYLFPDKKSTTKLKDENYAVEIDDIFK